MKIFLNLEFLILISIFNEEEIEIRFDSTRLWRQSQNHRQNKKLFGLSVVKFNKIAKLT